MKNVTILIPTTNIEIASKIVNSFLKSEFTNSIFIQFVFLVNPKTPCSFNSKWDKYDSHELITVYSDRYFGSCEENIYRSQDFSSCFKEYIFCIGDGDEINWGLLINVLDFVFINRLDACAWNIMHRQAHKDLEFTEENSISLMEINSSANNFVKLLFNGEVLPAGVGFPSLLSTYGPVDWAAYLGNHIFKRNVFESILRSRSHEFVYSFVFRQLKYFTDNPSSRYGFISQPVITRIADEFVKLQSNSNEKKISWLEDHRMVEGGTPIFWVAILDYLNSIDDENIFDFVINSFMYSHAPNEKYEIHINYHSSLVQLLCWCSASLHYKLSGFSYYLGQDVKIGSTFEIVYVCGFLKKLKDSIIRLLAGNESIIILINRAIICLELYLKDGQNLEILLIEAKDSIGKLINQLSQDIIIDLHLKSFNNYLEREY